MIILNLDYIEHIGNQEMYYSVLLTYGTLSARVTLSVVDYMVYELDLAIHAFLVDLGFRGSGVKEQSLVLEIATTFNLNTLSIHDAVN